MKKQIIAICDEDRFYAQKIYEYIHEREASSYEVILFTEIEAVERFMLRDRINILLVSSVSRALIKGKLNAEHILILTREATAPMQPDEIYKYQSGDKILKAVMQFCSERDKQTVKRKCGRPINVIGVYSPIKRAFQTTFSIALGQILAKKGKALYINFECFSGFDSLMNKNYVTDLMDLVYFWRLGESNFSYRLESMVESIGNLDFVPPVHSFRNFEEITGEQWTGFLNTLEEYTDYEYLVLDLSENVNGLLDILRMCRTVYTLTDRNRVSRAKLIQYEALLKEYCYSDVLEKTRMTEIPTFREIPGDFELLPYTELTRFIKEQVLHEELMREEGENAG